MKATMRTKKRPGTDDALSRKAAKALSEWRATTPEAASLPSPEAQPTRADRRAKLEYQAVHARDEATRKRVDEARKRERDEAAEREKLRNRRQRPHKHRPAWLADLPIVTETRERGGEPYKIDRLARPGETPTRIAVGPRWKVDAPARFAPVTEDLAGKAQALRALFDVTPKVREDGAFTSDGRDFVAVETVDAVRAAVAALADAWVTLLIDELLRAVEERRERALNPGAPLAAWKILDPDPNKPEDIARHVRAQTAHQFRGLVTVPDYVTDKVVRWALERVTLGHGAGRGKRVKLTPGSLRALLLSPVKLARAMGQAPGV